MLELLENVPSFSKLKN